MTRTLCVCNATERCDVTAGRSCSSSANRAETLVSFRASLERTRSWSSGSATFMESARQLFASLRHDQHRASVTVRQWQTHLHGFDERALGSLHPDEVYGC